MEPEYWPFGGMVAANLCVSQIKLWSFYTPGLDDYGVFFVPLGLQFIECDVSGKVQGTHGLALGGGGGFDTYHQLVN